MSSGKEIREKIVSRGASVLSDTELMSLLVNCDGKAEEDAESVADALLEKCGGLSAVGAMSISELRMCEGMGIRKAVVVSAAAEIGRRIKLCGMENAVVVRDKNDIVRLFEPVVAWLEHEELWVVYLTSANRLIEKTRVSQGGLSSLTVDNRIIIKRALELLASSIIIVHNHPSGAAHPSGEDRVVTDKIRQAAAMFDINLLDHIILSREGSFSFRNEGLI